MDPETKAKLDEFEQRLAKIERQVRRTWIAAAGAHQHDDTLAQYVSGWT